MLAAEEPKPAVVVPIDGILDLHAFRPRDLGTLVPEYLEQCRRRGILQARLVHGKGTGALARGVQALLRRLPAVVGFRLAGPGAGDWGATLVWLAPLAPPLPQGCGRRDGTAGQSAAGPQSSASVSSARGQEEPMAACEEQLLATVDSLRGQQHDWTVELVRIPTVNPYAGDESAGSEAAGQDWLEDRLRALGATVRRVPVPPDVYARGGIIGPAERCWEGRTNVVGTWVLGDGNGPAILLNDHMDTVGTAGMTVAPHAATEAAGRLYGRGASDTKGNLVMGLIAVAAVLRHQTGLRGRIVFESVVDEECNGAGAGTLACCLAGITGDVAICLDGDGDQVDVGCNGVATARIRIAGQAAHGSGSGAVSALDMGIVAKEAIDAFAAEHRREFPQCAVNIGVFRAGTLPAIVPAAAELQVNLNYDRRDAERAAQQSGQWDGRVFRARFEAAMGQLAARAPWFATHPAEVSWIKDMYPYWCDPADARIQTILAAVAQVRGAPVATRTLPAWFDAAHLARQLRIPAVGLGFGAPGTAHAAAEYVELGELYLGARAVALSLYRLLRA